MIPKASVATAIVTGRASGIATRRHALKAETLQPSRLEQLGRQAPEGPVVDEHVQR